MKYHVCSYRSNCLDQGTSWISCIGKVLGLDVLVDMILARPCSCFQSCRVIDKTITPKELCRYCTVVSMIVTQPALAVVASSVGCMFYSVQHNSSRQLVRIHC